MLDTPFESGGAYGAVGILNESVENRKVKDLLIQKLRDRGTHGIRYHLRQRVKSEWNSSGK